MDFVLNKPLPSRGSAEALRDQLIEHLLRASPPVGSRFLSDHELTRLTQVSRPTVRRALDELSREGWIERRHGIGTFVGPRAALRVPAARRPEPERPDDRSVIRLAVMIHLLGDYAHDWYARGIVAGIDQAGFETGVAVELLGDQDGDLHMLSRRLMQTRPDTVALVAPPPAHVHAVAECRRLGIPCIGTGTLLAMLGVTAVHEDGARGAAEAVRHLAEQGHRRVGLVMPPYPIPWVFQRRQGYLDGLRAAGLTPDEGLVHWLEGNGAAQAEHLYRYLEQRRPTALLFGSFGAIEHLSPLIRDGRLRVPQDLSVVTFDQNPDVARWLGDVPPATVALPLVPMGQALAHIARQVADGGTPPPVTALSCELIPGGSVGPPAR